MKINNFAHNLTFEIFFLFSGKLFYEQIYSSCLNMEHNINFPFMIFEKINKIIKYAKTSFDLYFTFPVNMVKPSILVAEKVFVPLEMPFPCSK